MNYFIYLSFLAVGLGLIRLHDDVKGNGAKLSVFTFLLVIVCFFGVFRYDVGNDYAGYVAMFEKINNFTDERSINYVLYSALSRLFSFSENGFVFVIGAYYVFTVSIFLYILKKKDILFWGFFTFVTFGLLFDSFDRIRQMAALAVFMLAVEDIVKKDFKRFVLKLALGALFHYSIVILMPLYFISRVRVNVFLYSLLFFVMLVGYYLGVWVSTYEYVYSLIPYYRDIYAGTKYSAQAVELGTGVGFLGVVLFIYMNILLAPVNRVYKNILSFGLVIYIFGVGNLNITRISDYLLAVSVVTFPFLVKRFKTLGNKLIVVAPMLIFLMVFFVKSLHSGIYFEYKTIFSDDYKDGFLEYRHYKDEW